MVQSGHGVVAITYYVVLPFSLNIMLLRYLATETGRSSDDTPESVESLRSRMCHCLFQIDVAIIMTLVQRAAVPCITYAPSFLIE